ncbi:hypothetical protein, unlikely [Trypanosoma congolense IL3000]|uniref:Uncharacterized protein n=1 Tax=Trypanosoma congolense (strain IL3000) TaxID=1068625 RepID=F9WJQ9_TRYCI|nr:hypothetical protein, unlikely [Trypanosoma congolense IL3000]
MVLTCLQLRCLPTHTRLARELLLLLFWEEKYIITVIFISPLLCLRLMLLLLLLFFMSITFLIYLFISACTKHILFRAFSHFLHLLLLLLLVVACVLVAVGVTRAHFFYFPLTFGRSSLRWSSSQRTNFCIGTPPSQSAL